MRPQLPEWVAVELEVLPVLEAPSLWVEAWLGLQKEPWLFVEVSLLSVEDLWLPTALRVEPLVGLLPPP